MAPYLTDAQLRAELQRCQSCEAKPCRSGCPASLSPADFIMAARCGEPSDYRRAAAQILGQNPLGETCGSVCPETLCMARCARRALDGPVNIPAIQAAILRRARELGVLPHLAPRPASGHRVAVVGAGPAGLGAASVLARAGHAVHLFDRAKHAGGLARLIPRDRLDPGALDADVDRVLGEGDVRLVLGRPVPLPRDLLTRGFAAVVVAAGLGEPVELDVPGRERAVHWTRVLGDRPPALRGKRVAVVGDGAVALDCADAAAALGAAHVELFALKKLTELGLGRRERERLFASDLHVSGRVRVTAIRGRGKRLTALALRRVELPAGQPYHPSRLFDLPHGEHERRDLDAVIVAIGGRAVLRREPHPRIVYAGDLESGPTSVVAALASGKRAGLTVHGRLAGGDDLTACPDRGSCPGGSGCPRAATCPEWSRPATTEGAPAAPRPPAGPVALDCEVLGRTLRSPFVLAASPFTASYEQVKRAYEAGWAGALVTASGEEGAVERLRREFPDRLTLTRPSGALAGDPASYRAAAELLACGARGLLVDALARRHGLGIVNELQAGLSWFLAERGLGSVSALVGSAAPAPGSGVSPPERLIAAIDPSLCTGCGNCTRCPRLAVAVDARGLPRVDAARCTGCGACEEQCLVGAMALGPAPQDG